tara:strand:- start:456 stop:728 length:273 start_codon:yes stop_codon:yes gene_type:complete
MVISKEDYVTIHQAIHSKTTSVLVRGVEYQVTQRSNGCRSVKVPRIGTFIEQSKTKETDYSKRAKQGEAITWLIRDLSWGLIVNDEVINQ